MKLALLAGALLSVTGLAYCATGWFRTPDRPTPDSTGGISTLAAAPGESKRGGPSLRGVGLAHLHRRGMGYGSERSAAELDRLRGIGANAVALTPFLYMADVDEPALRWRDIDGSLTDADLAKEIRNAKARGHHVQVKPHIWSRAFWSGKEWHGTIAMKNDADWEAWFAEYTVAMLHWAKLSADNGADSYVVGTELMGTTLTKPDKWRALIAKVRAVFPGELTYAAHWDREYDGITFWGDLDVIGVNAYFPVAKGDERDPTKVAAAFGPWMKKIQALHERFERPVYFTEVGYTHHPGSCAEPWRYGEDGREVVHEAQAVCYEGLMRALDGAPFVRGIFLWKWFTAYGDGSYENDAFSPRGKPAEAIMKQWFTAWSGR